VKRRVNNNGNIDLDAVVVDALHMACTKQIPEYHARSKDEPN